jgi:hypothetical protein
MPDLAFPHLFHGNAGVFLASGREIALHKEALG